MTWKNILKINIRNLKDAKRVARDYVPEDLIEGCTYPLADNYDSSATLDDGSCIVNNIPESSWTYGCKDSNAITEEMAQILYDDGLIPSVSGYYDSSATIDNSLCYYETSFD